MREASNSSNQNNKMMPSDSNSILTNTNTVPLSSIPVMSPLQRLSHRTNRRNTPRDAKSSDSDRRRLLVNILDDALKIVDDITNSNSVNTADMSRTMDTSLHFGSNITVLNDSTFGQNWNQRRENHHGRQANNRDNDTTSQESYKTADATSKENFPSQ